MELDLPGKVANTRLPQSRSLLPLFEAIINSAHSIEESHADSGTIKVTVLRENQQEMLATDGESWALHPVIGFTVEDNGVGFTDANFQSFQTSDSTYKKSRGAKGVGRFTWLKAFKEVEVTSVYQENDVWYRRAFRFTVNGNGVSDNTLVETDERSNKTTVQLRNWNEPYSDGCPKKPGTIAQRIIDHCFLTLLSDKPPCVELFDSSTFPLNLNELLSLSIINDTKSLTFTIGNHHFAVRVLEIRAGEESQQRVYWCANGREVFSESVSHFVPDLKRGIATPDGDSAMIVGYVSGTFLDESVNQERTDFYFDGEDGIDFTGGITKGQIDSEVRISIEKHYQSYLDSLSEQRTVQVREFVNNKAPQYRGLVNHPELLQDLEVGLPDEKLDLELHKRQAQLELAVKRKGVELLSKKPSEVRDLPEYKQKFDDYLEGINEISKAKLADYIVHRKSVLDLLEQQLVLTSSGRYGLEESIHKLVFPMRTTSDDVPYDAQNLWIIDEKLSYHFYLASDVPLRKNKMVNGDDLDRPDLVIFQAPVALADGPQPYSSVVIVEFKRPARDDYKEDDNPITQVFDYIRKIRSGKAVDRKGRPMNVADTTPFYSYIVCDLTSKIKAFAENADFTLSPDNLGYFHFNKNLRSYIEIISFGKLVADARKRNQVLFDKLNLPL
jgi:hypothetical protein